MTSAAPAAAIDPPVAVAPARPAVVFQWSTHSGQPDGSTEFQSRGLGWVDLITGEEHRLTEDGQDHHHSASWSPDGRHVLFVQSAGDGSGTRSVVVVDVATGEQSVLATGDAPAWSPDGELLAYASGAGESRQILIAPIERVADGWRLGASAAVVPVPHLQHSLTWSPTGDRLAFTVQGQPEDPWPMSCDVWTVLRDGSGLRQITSGLDVMWGPVSWSPSGDVVAFEVGDLAARTSGRTWFADADGASPRPAHSSTWDDGGSWSPVADLFAMSVQGANEIAVVTPQGAELHRYPLPDQNGIFAVRWLPTATELVFSATPWPSDIGTPHSLWRMSLAGEDPRRLGSSEVVPTGFSATSPGLAVRLFGATRIETALALSRSVFTTATDVVLAPASDAAHALVGAPLAGSVGGPLLLTSGETLEPGVLYELARLNVERVWLLGDAAAIDERVQASIAAKGIEVRRLAVADAASLATAVAEELGGDTAYAVRVDDGDIGWPDAVSISASAAHEATPVLLVGHEHVPQATRDAIHAQSIRSVTIVGGTAAVSNAVADELRALGVSVARLAGRDRYETSRLVAERAAASGLSSSRPFLATGANWPDSVAAGPAAAAAGRLLLLVDGDASGRDAASADWLSDRSGSFVEIGVVGGSGAVSLAAEALLEDLVGGAPI